MGKCIQLTRSELVWETRQNTFNQQDWEIFIKEIKRHCEELSNDDDRNNAHYFRALYAMIKDLTWDEACTDFNRAKNGADRKGLIQTTYRKCTYDWGFSDGQGRSLRTPEKDYDVTMYLYEELEEEIRERNYGYDVIDTQYADDYNEDFKLLEADN